MLCGATPSMHGGKALPLVTSFWRSSMHQGISPLLIDRGLATEFTISATDVELLCGLSPGWFDRDAAEVVTLKLASSDVDNSPRGEGQIIAFPDRRR